MLQKGVFVGQPVSLFCWVCRPKGVPYARACDKLSNAPECDFCGSACIPVLVGFGGFVEERKGGP